MTTPIQGRSGTAPLPWPEIENIVVLRALFLGDMLCSVPALRALRHAAPQAHIALVGLPWAQEFAGRYPGYIDEFIAFPGFPGLPELPVAAEQVVEFLAAMQRRQFDLAIQLHGSGGHVNEAIELFGASRTAGYFGAGSYCPDEATYFPYPHAGAEIRRHLELMAFLGVSTQGEHLELVIDDADERSIFDVAPELDGQEYVCLHAGGKLATRRWPAERFAAVGDALACDGFRIALTGTASDEDSVAQVARAMHAPCLNLCGITNLGGLAALVRNAALVVTNDTGVSHVAAAVRTPSVVVWLGSDDERWRPLDESRNRIVAHSVPCRPCESNECPFEFECALGISPRQVVEVAHDVLRNNRMTRSRRDALAAGGVACVA